MTAFHRLGFLFMASATVSLASQSTLAEDPLLFISSFAPGDQGAIHACRLNLETGRLATVKRTGGVEHPFFLALSPDRKHLYSIHGKEFSGKEDEQVAAYELVGPEGELKLLNRVSAKGKAACYLMVDATGKSVVLANYTTGSVAAFPVQADGSLGEAASFIQHKGSSVDKARQEGPHAHCFVISPDNRFALSADLGTDQVFVYKLDAANAKLSPNAPPFVKSPAGGGPRHLTFHPNGKFVYVINELGNTVSVYAWDKEAGSLTDLQTISTVPAEFKGTSHTADVKITPDGRYLYGTNRGHDSLAAYRIGDDGRLTLVAIEPSLGKGPQNLAIVPGGKLLICANMAGSNVAVFRINAETGRLTSTGETLQLHAPSCIQIVP